MSGDRKPPDSILEANLSALGGRFPELAALVAEAKGRKLEVAPAASGEASARYPGGARLHSSRDPRAEARRVAEASGAGADTAVLLGLGLGYLAEALLEPRPPAVSSGARVGGGAPGVASGAALVERVIACEADPAALNAAFRARDMSALLADERLGFVVGGEPEGLVSALELSGGLKAAILGLPSLLPEDGPWFEAARRAAERWNAKGAVNENTLRRFGRLWVRNLARNLGTSSSSPGVERLEGLFAGGAGVPPIPALVLAAGPSLDLVLPRIEELSRRALVVCVDTALRSLLRFGLEPDFLVVVDPQYWNWRHLSGLSSPSSFLVSEAATWPAVFRAPRRGAFLGGSLFPLGRRIEAFAGRKGQLGAGGSVATSAWDLCRIMGCSPVWMAGLDLSYPGGRTHAAASLFEQRALASGGRLAPAATDQAAALVGGQSYEAPSADGSLVRTDQRMALYAWWFESRFARPSSPRTVSLSRGGLGIPGLELGGVEGLLACPERRSSIDEALGRAAAMGPPEGWREGAAAGLESLRERLDRLARSAERAEVAAREGRTALLAGGDWAPFVSILDDADAEILEEEARDIVGFLLPSLQELVGGRARDLAESLETSASLYRSLAESARYHIEALGQALLSGEY